MADMSKVKLPDNSIYNLRDNRFIYEKSVEAAQIASFSDGANDIPLKELSLSINPTQSGSGDPYPAGGSAQKWDEVWELGYINSSTGTNAGSSNCIRSKNHIPVNPSQSYYFLTNNKTAYIRCYDANKTFIPSNNVTVTNATYNVPSDTYYIRFFMEDSYGTTYGNNMSLNYPSTDTSYHPYSNIRPITGVSSVNVYRFSGPNYWDEQWEAGGYNNLTGEKTPVVGRIRNTNMIKVNPSTAYYVKFTSSAFVVLQYDINKNFIAGVSSYTSSGVLNTSANTAYINFYLVTNEYGNDISINYPSTDTSYHAYQGNTYLIQLGDTYYGGELYIDSAGNVKYRLKYVKSIIDKTVFRDYSSANIDFQTQYNRMSMRNLFYGAQAYGNYYNRQIQAGGFYCKSNVFKVIALNDRNYISTQYRTFWTLPNGVTDYASWQTYMQGLIDNDVEVHFVYEFTQGSPIEIDLTPTQINSLLGSNNIWHDANGTTACTYRVNTPLVDAIKDISPEVTIDDSKTVTDQTWSSSKIASEISSATAGVIDDTTTDTDTTWSSSKISTELATKTEVDDTTASATKTYSSNKIEDIIEAITPRTGTVTDQAVATFSDGADNVPMKSITLSINPTQSGSGDPYPAGGGKNKLPPFTNGTYTQNSIKAVVKDGLITVTGQKDTASGINLTLPLSKTFTLKQNDYLHIRNSNSNASITLSFAGAGWSPAFASTNRIIQYTGADASVTGVTIYFAGTVTEEQNFTFQPSIEVGSAVTDWTPYDNIRPITGVSSVKVFRVGKNLAYIQNSTLYPRGENLPIAENANTRTCYARVPKNTNIVITKSASTNRNIVYGIDGEPAVGVLCHSLTYTNSGLSYFVNTGNYEYIGFYFGNESVNIQIEIGSTASAYSAYQGDTYTIALGDTYYGATLDVVRGKLRVTHRMWKLGSSIYWYYQAVSSSRPYGLFYYPASFKKSGKCGIIADRYKELNSADSPWLTDKCIYEGDGNNYIYVIDSSYTTTSAFAEANKDSVIVCELATPIEIDLTPTQINTLLGSNNIWHDGNGNISCEYYKTGCEPIARLIESYTDKPTFFNGTLFN